MKFTKTIFYITRTEKNSERSRIFNIKTPRNENNRGIFHRKKVESTKSKGEVLYLRVLMRDRIKDMKARSYKAKNPVISVGGLELYKSMV